MILDTFARASSYRGIHELFGAGFDFLLRPDLASLADGRYEIADGVYALAMRDKGRARKDAQLEVHRAYIDIQAVLAGTDTIGWKPLAGCATPVADFDTEKDLQLFRDAPDAWIPVHPRQFAVFFPADAHAPMVADEQLHKVVVKVAVDSA